MRYGRSVAAIALGAALVTGGHLYRAGSGLGGESSAGAVPGSAPAEAPAGDAGPTGAEGEESMGQDEPEGYIDPLGPNAACYVCHMTFIREEISKQHLAQEVGCIECHGVSAGHANDEDIGATPPDITYKREEIDSFCAECHETHNAPADDVVARFVQRKLPAGTPPVCTDCHGHHRIDRAVAAGHDRAGSNAVGRIANPTYRQTQ